MGLLKWLVAIFATLFALLLVAFLAAVMLMPSERNFANEVEISAPAEKVWQVILDKRRYAEWQTAITKVEIVDEKNWSEYPKDVPDPLVFTITGNARPETMEFHYTMGDSFNGHWRGVVTLTATGVKLQTTDSYKVDGSVSKVLIGVFFDIDTFAKDWNSKLKARVESLK